MDQSSEKLSPLVWVLIVGAGFTRGAFFMAMPFLALHLKIHYQLEATTIGWILSAGPLMGTVVGFYGAYISDKIGRKGIVIWSMILWGVVLLGFTIAQSVWAFVVLSGLSGIMRAIVEPVIQAIISEQTPESSRARAFHYRYYAVNLGATAGPAAGAWLLVEHPIAGFAIAGLSFFIFALVFAVLYPKNYEPSELQTSTPGVLKVLSILARDRALKYYVLASILCAVAYAQTESTLPLILVDQLKEGGVNLFGWLLSINAATIVLFQLPLNKWTKNYDVTKTVALSCLVFALGYVGFSFSSHLVWAYILSAVVLALGEILVFSNGYLLIDRLAPTSVKASYHSAANLFAVGFAFGPPLGSWFYVVTNQVWLFLAAAVLLVGSAYLYLHGGRAETQASRIAPPSI